MSKVSNAILMLKILESGKIFKIRELADIIECSPRAIRTYKEDLEKAGIYINTIFGKYGGYIYEQSNKVDYYTFNKYELRALENCYLALKESSKNKKKNIKYLQSVINKIRYFVVVSNISNKNELESDVVRDYYRKISYAIHENRKIEFYYCKRKKQKIYRVMKPQNIYVYDEKYFVTGVIEEIKEIRTFGFEEIKNLKII